jgi:hypothetical protein
MLGYRLEQPLRSFSSVVFRTVLLIGLTSCIQTQQDPEEVAMTVGAVVSGGPNCAWDGTGGQLLTGEMDLISVASPGGAIGHSRRYPIGVQWAVSAAEQAASEFGDSFITLKDVEVRLMYDDAVVAPPTDETRENLPATYVVPTMGTQDVNTAPIAVFDLIPTWVAQRLALDRQIWLDTSKDSALGTRIPAPGKGYLLATEFRLRGYNAAGKRLVSNWFRWVISLCRGCRMSFTTTPPSRPAPGVAGFPGHYGADEINQQEPLPSRPGIVTWCSAGVSQATFALDVVQPSQPLVPRTY